MSISPEPPSIVNYKEFDFEELVFETPEKSRSGSYVSSGKYQGNDLYIQTPRLKMHIINKNR